MVTLELPLPSHFDLIILIAVWQCVILVINYGLIGETHTEPAQFFIFFFFSLKKSDLRLVGSC